MLPNKQIICKINLSCDSKLKTECMSITVCVSLLRLDRFEKTNEMLINFNGLSNVRLQQMNDRFLLHTRTLIEMKKDLDSIFRRIRYKFTVVQSLYTVWPKVCKPPLNQIGEFS